MFYTAPSRDRRRQKGEPMHHIVLAARTPVLNAYGKTSGHQNLSEGLATSDLLLFHQTISLRLWPNYCVYLSYMTGWQIKGNKRHFSREIKIRGY
jgi:hypothetical protein